MTDGCTFTYRPDEGAGSTLEGPWHCPHEAFEDADRCLFHLTPSERDQRAVDDGAVVAAFKDRAEQAGARPKQFVGAHFGDLDLQRVVVEAPDNHPIDLRHVTVDGTLGFAHTAIEQPLRLRDSEVATLEWTDAEFGADLDMAGLTCRGTVDAEAVSVDGDIDAVGATFEGAVTLDEARCHGDSCFRETRFAARVQCRGCEFRGDANLLDDDACFEYAVFEDDVAFTKTTFRYADFVDATFEGDAKFTEATFEGDAEFADATFEGDAAFAGAEFHGGANVLIVDADFTDAAFLGDATFESAQFRGAVFDDARFAKGATFGECSFDGSATFAAVAFERETDFSEARFRDDATFTDARFAGALSLSGAEFHGGDNADDDDLNFADATFGGHLDAAKAEVAQATFEDATFDATATFHEGSFTEEVSFESVAFGDDVEFGEVRFGGDATFEQCQFEGDAAFAGAEFEGGNYVEDDDVTFSDATFGGRAEFQGCRFQFANFDGVRALGPAAFTDARFSLDATFANAEWEDEVTFLETRFREDVDFEGAVFSGPALFRGAEFHGGANTEEDDLRLADARFEGVADFYAARFRFANFRRAAFADAATFSETVFSNDARFDQVRFEDEATFDEARFQDDASFEDAVFESDCQFRGVEFQGGANVLDDDVAFDGSTFRGTASFAHGELGFADFSEAVFEASALFEGTEFTDEASFVDFHVAEVADFDGASFVGVVTFQGAEFGGETQFDQAQFENGAKFADAAFRSAVEFTGTAFEDNPTDLSGDADFERATFDAAVTFDRAEFRSANFSCVEFGAPASFESVVFEDDAVYDDAEAVGDFLVSQSRFLGDTSLESVRFGSAATFSGSVFSGGTSSDTDAVSFDGSSFEGDAAFDDCEFQTASFVETVFAAGASFEAARFDQSLHVQAAPRADAALVDMRRAELAAGRITQPESGNTFYDLTGTTVRDVTLEGNDSEFPLLDYFLFVETDFDGFDFSTHMRELSRNNWNIHGFRYGDVVDDASAVRQSALSWSELERTYLMAKNSASELGHRKAAAEFYIKEFTFRRKKNKATFVHGGVDTGGRKRLVAGGKWFGNLLLYETCGYGERIWRILYVSAMVIVTWALLYLTVSEGTRGPGDVTTASFTSLGQVFTPEGVTSIGHALYFSLVTFTTLGYGDVQPIGPTARLLASLESFLGALLVALVVFVIGRRMA